MSLVAVAVFDAALPDLFCADDCTHPLSSATAHSRKTTADADTTTVEAECVPAVRRNKASTGDILKNDIDDFAPPYLVPLPDDTDGIPNLTAFAEPLRHIASHFDTTELVEDICRLNAFVVSSNTPLTTCARCFRILGPSGLDSERAAALATSTVIEGVHTSVIDHFLYLVPDLFHGD